jgi:hypothetical protein
MTRQSGPHARGGQPAPVAAPMAISVHASSNR